MVLSGKHFCGPSKESRSVQALLAETLVIRIKRFAVLLGIGLIDQGFLRRLSGLRKVVQMPVEEMTREEIDQFLTCAKVGRLGLSVGGTPHIVPLSYVYVDGRIVFHTCNRGFKMQALRENLLVCFEVDEALSDASMYKSVVASGKAEILEDEEEMIPYLQRLIDKYRVPQAFDEYMSRPGRDREKEMKAVRICIIKLTKITGRKFIR
jgi:nitroimidazol reductase NimA-like FMN-containing flavoprotein (pyridoxamine 5'-phosphate oxidase superfamily)